MGKRSSGPGGASWNEIEFSKSASTGVSDVTGWSTSAVDAIVDERRWALICCAPGEIEAVSSSAELFQSTHISGLNGTFSKLKTLDSSFTGSVGDDIGILPKPPEENGGKSGVTGEIELELDNEFWWEVCPYEPWSFENVL